MYLIPGRLPHAHIQACTPALFSVTLSVRHCAPLPYRGGTAPLLRLGVTGEEETLNVGWASGARLANQTCAVCAVCNTSALVGPGIAACSPPGRAVYVNTQTPMECPVSHTVSERTGTAPEPIKRPPWPDSKALCNRPCAAA